jgi:hypothetical protein
MMQSEHKAKRGDTMKFYDWMMQYVDEKSPRGDLARDMQYDAGESLPWNHTEFHDERYWEHRVKIANYEPSLKVIRRAIKDYHRQCQL